MDVENEIKKLQDRNTRVEAEHDWNISVERKILVSLITYLFMVLVLFALKISKPFANALIPTIGFFLSTLTLSAFRDIWLKRKRKTK